MRLIELTQKADKKDLFQKYIDQIKGMVPIGKTEEHAEEAIIARFVRSLDNRFVMLRNFQPDDQALSFPPILVGPSGLLILNINHGRGFFRVKEDSWWEMDKITHRFNPVHPNLVKQSQEYAKRLASVLDMHGKAHPDVLPVLIFSNPGVHVEMTNPAARIVLFDGVESLIANLITGWEVLKPPEINYLTESLEVMVNPEKAIPVGEGEDFFGQDLIVPEKKAPPKLPRIPIPTELPLQPVEERLKFSQKQWVILAVLLLLTIVVLLFAIVYVLSTTRI